MTYVYISLGVAALSLGYAFAHAFRITKQKVKSARVEQIGKYISDGSMAFLRAEYSILIIVVIGIAILLGVANAYFGTHASSYLIAVSFIIGAICSALAGFIGMKIATVANVRTTDSAQISLAAALSVAFRGGLVMGLCVVSLGVLGLGSLYVVYSSFLGMNDIDIILSLLSGFSLGASTIALFARVGGGIYTKAADVGADLVGKVEAGIPEDHPLNPATIADNVGDNVGDVAGMGADLFESYVGSILGSMVLGASFVGVFQSMGLTEFNGLNAVLLPITIAALGIISSIIGTFFVKIRKEGNPQRALNLGHWVASIVMIGFSYLAINELLPKTWDAQPILALGDGVYRTFTSMGVFLSVIYGLFVGLFVGIITEYYTGTGRRPVLNIVKQSTTGSATNIISGFALGMRSTGAITILIVVAILLSYNAAGLYGIALAALGMLANTGIQLAIDGYGPIADNAGGIAEMAELPTEVRERTDQLDAVGNTTAAIGKGFAISSAALTALALFAAYMKQANLSVINISNPTVMSGLFIGAMLPFIFSALAIESVGRAAMSMIQEVRRQFKEIPALNKALAIMKKHDGDTSQFDEAEKQAFSDAMGAADYSRCVAISTNSALKEMIAPSLLALSVPVLIGFTLGKEALGGLLAGVTVCGVLLAIFQANAGGAWDNAKKMVEKGVTIGDKHYGKGSDIHKATVVGDTVGDPLKDTSGPSINILIKLIAIVALVIVPLLEGFGDLF